MNPPDSRPADPRLHRAALAAALVVFGLIVAGAQVTSNDAGLAVPDWPLAYGQLFPDRWTEIRNIFIEHFHRVYAFTVGVLALALAAWFHFREPGALQRQLAYALPVLVLIQGLIGGLRIGRFNALYPPILHGVFGQLTFAAFAALAVATAVRWRAASAGGRPGALPRAVALLLLAQLVLAALMRHQRWGLAIPDLPLLRGALPAFDSTGVAVAFAHRALGSALLLALAAQALALRRAPAPAAGLAFAAALLAALQIALGAATVLTGRNPWLASLHTANGALLLVLQVALLLWLTHVPAGEEAR